MLMFLWMRQSPESLQQLCATVAQSLIVPGKLVLRCATCNSWHQKDHNVMTMIPGLSLEELLSTLKARLKTTVAGPSASSVCALMYSRAGLRGDFSNSSGAGLSSAACSPRNDAIPCICILGLQAELSNLGFQAVGLRHTDQLSQGACVLAHPYSQV